MPPKKTKLLKIGAVDDFKEGQSKKFNVDRPNLTMEAFVFRKGGQLRAYLNLCRHWTVGLDLGDNDFFSEEGEWIVCKNHGALYNPLSGECVSGPCNGASLYRVPLVEKKGSVYVDVANVDWGEV